MLVPRTRSSAGEQSRDCCPGTGQAFHVKPRTGERADHDLSPIGAPLDRGPAAGEGAVRSGRLGEAGRAASSRPPGSVRSLHAQGAGWSDACGCHPPIRGSVSSRYGPTATRRFTWNAQMAIGVLQMHPRGSPALDGLSCGEVAIGTSLPAGTEERQDRFNPQPGPTDEPPPP